MALNLPSITMPIHAKVLEKVAFATSMIEACPSMPIHQVFPTLAYVPLGVKLPKVSCVQILNLL